MKLDVRYDRATLLTTSLKFEEFPDELRDQLRAKIGQLAEEAFGLVSAGVPRATGRLASELQISLRDDPSGVSASINFGGAGATSSDFAKAGALEYGSKSGRKFNVSAHHLSRDIVFGRALSAPIDVLQQAYDRQGGIMGEAFVRSANAAFQQHALDELNAVVDRAAAKLLD